MIDGTSLCTSIKTMLETRARYFGCHRRHVTNNIQMTSGMSEHTFGASHHGWHLRHLAHQMRHECLWTLSVMSFWMSWRMSTETPFETSAETSRKFLLGTSLCSLDVIANIAEDVAGNIWTLPSSLTIVWRVSSSDVEFWLPCRWRAVNSKMNNMSTCIWYHKFQ